MPRSASMRVSGSRRGRPRRRAARLRPGRNGDPAAPGEELGDHAGRLGLARDASCGESGAFLRGDVEARARHLGPRRGVSPRRLRLGGFSVAVILHGTEITTAVGVDASAHGSPERQRERAAGGGGRAVTVTPRPDARRRSARSVRGGRPDRRPRDRRDAVRGVVGGARRALPAAHRPRVPVARACGGRAVGSGLHHRRSARTLRPRVGPAGAGWGGRFGLAGVGDGVRRLDVRDARARTTPW